LIGRYLIIANVLSKGIPTFGKNAVVCGRSKNVGMPIAMLLHADNAGIYDENNMPLVLFCDCHFVTIDF